ncbi:hypothetical protein SAY87_023384 [Trapa incisa]|uniref:RING-type E3 ubiquitin transferase n=1 Tax=Trapa incisa TaxID=236973 RepID=A0AAN7KSG8_9MYRT|nr:hypothetical protein SAY87_023384 [Trapa incisa]
MASAAIFSSLRRRRSPSLEVLLAPADLSDVALVQSLASISVELVSCFSGKSFFLQRKNSRSLIRRIGVFVVLLEFLRDSGRNLPPTAVLCFKELYLVLYRSMILLDYCTQSGKLWLLLQNRSISGHFQDLNQEIYTLLDVLPVKDLKLNEDIKEQIELLQRQARRDCLFVDKHDEAMRVQLFSFLLEFDKGRVPSRTQLKIFFMEKLKIRDAKSCRAEIEYLEEQVAKHEGDDLEPPVSMLNGFIALTRYCRFLLYRVESEQDEFEDGISKKLRKKNKKDLITPEIAGTFAAIPKDFCCPISLDLMKDPVITSTGQTFDRCSILRWVQEGHVTCPKTGQMLAHTKLVPNRVLRNLINQWCTAHGIAYEPPEAIDSSTEFLPAASPSKAVIEANKATSALLVQDLRDGSQSAKSVAAREIRFLAKIGKENRALIAEAGAIPYLIELLSSNNPVSQENSVTAMLNLSIYDKNKSRIMEEGGCLKSIVEVLRFWHTAEARENAAATLFSLSAVHDYKKRIAGEEGAVEAISGLLRNGTSRGKKDAVMVLFNLSTHAENCAVMVESGAVATLVCALGDEGVAEEAAGALALIARQPLGASAVLGEESVVGDLIGMMRSGTPRGKENAVSALLELCRSGGTAAMERILRAPALVGLLQTLLFTGTKRARRKAASLARVFRRSENGSLHLRGLGQGYVFAAANSSVNMSSGFAGDVSMPVSISVPASS